MGRARTAINIYELREMARRRLPRMVFDYIDGGAEDEVSLRRSVSRFEDYEFTWNVLRDVAEIDTSIEIMGARSRLPFLIAPTAASRLFHPRAGELAVARAAHAAGIAYSCSTLASQTLEAIAKHCAGPKWVQVYVWRDKSLVQEFLLRAKRAGFTGCILTVDLAVAGKRERDPRNRFTMPPRLSPSLLAQVAGAPGWLMETLTSPPIRFANFKHAAKRGDVMSFIDSQYSRSVTWEDAAWMKQIWGEHFAIKGVASVEDARRCLEVGADAVWVSNHGGRQLDTARPTIDLIGDIAEAIGGRAQIILDGGVRRGSHIVKALARGATAVAIGRAWLYGLATDGEAGVARAIAILEDELRRTMALLGVTRVADLNGALLRLRGGA